MRLLLTAVASALFLFSINGAALAGDKHLFYLNGCCLNKVGVSGYESMMKKLGKEGFKVNFEARYDDNYGAIEFSSLEVADEVKKLIAGGTPPGDITVAGFSLGSVITMYAALAIDNPRVNYILLAGCPVHSPRHYDIDYAKIHGRVLSIIDQDDNRYGSCGNKLSGATPFKEVTIRSGSGHKGFRLPGSMQNWVKPMKAWIENP